MPSRPVHFPALAILSLLASPALAGGDGGWAVRKAPDSPVGMSRTIDGVTVDYYLVPGDYDALSIKVADCGGQPWDMDESINAADAESLRPSVAELFANARMNCQLAENIEDRFLAGFDEAFNQVKPTVPPHVQTVAGWLLEDKGSHPGDDSDRSLLMSRELPNITMVYRPDGSGESASISIQFKPCDGLSYNAGFDFGNPPQDHAAIVAEQVKEAYADFAEECRKPPEPQSALMQGFPEALATIEQWLKDKPFVYPPTPAQDDAAPDETGPDESAPDETPPDNSVST